MVLQRKLITGPEIDYKIFEEIFPDFLVYVFEINNLKLLIETNQRIAFSALILLFHGKNYDLINKYDISIKKKLNLPKELTYLKNKESSGIVLNFIIKNNFFIYFLNFYLT